MSSDDDLDWDDLDFYFPEDPIAEAVSIRISAARSMGLKVLKGINVFVKV